jgi:hypothetical protein
MTALRQVARVIDRSTPTTGKVQLRCSPGVLRHRTNTPCKRTRSPSIDLRDSSHVIARITPAQIESVRTVPSLTKIAWPARVHSAMAICADTAGLGRHPGRQVGIADGPSVHRGVGSAAVSS